MMTRTLIDANIGFLEQGLDLLDRIDPERFSSAPLPGLSSAGAHLRHILDHYLSFLDGTTAAEHAEVDYDRRERSALVERDPSTAAQVTRDVIDRLRHLTVSVQAPVQVRMDCGPGVPSDAARSSMARELQFLVSHTVHHFALMKAVLVTSGMTLPDDFGVAPSTLSHRADSACAH